MPHGKAAQAESEYAHRTDQIQHLMNAVKQSKTAVAASKAQLNLPREIS